MSQDSVVAGSPSSDGSSGARKALGNWPPVLAALAVLIGMQILVQRWVVNHDAALYLHCGRLLIEGYRPYIDFIDLNPPMIMYVSALPAWLAGVLSIHIIFSFHLCVFALLAYSVLMTRRLLIRSGLAIPSGQIVSMMLLLLIYSYVLLRSQDVDWGQREHLFLLGYTPFFLARWIRWSGGTVGPAAGAVSGVMAGFGACLKPHFAVLAILVELAQLIRERRLRPLLYPEALAFVGVGAVYGLHFLVLPMEIREAFFERWLPMIQQGYGAYNQPWPTVLLRIPVYITVTAMLVAFLITWRRNNVLSRQARLWVLFSAAALLVYVLQHKGWIYQIIPAVFGSLAALIAAAGDVGLGRKIVPSGMPTRRQAVVLTLGILATSVTPIVPRLSDGFRPWPDPGFGSILRSVTDEGSSLLFLSTSVGQIYPLLLQVEREAGSRYLWTFPIPMLYADEPGRKDGAFTYRTRASMEEPEQRFLDELHEDIRNREPQMILIDAHERPQGSPPGFTVPGYFEASGFIDKEMSEYRYINDIFGWQVYMPVDAPLPTLQTAGND